MSPLRPLDDSGCIGTTSATHACHPFRACLGSHGPADPMGAAACLAVGRRGAWSVVAWPGLDEAMKEVVKALSGMAC